MRDKEDGEHDADHLKGGVGDQERLAERSLPAFSPIREGNDDQRACKKEQGERE